MEALTKVFQTKHRKSTTYYPRCNGQAESTNKKLKKILTKMAQTVQGTWNIHLQFALWAYRTAYTVTTKHPSNWHLGKKQLSHLIPALRTTVEHQLDPDNNLQERLLALEKLDELRQKALWEHEVAQKKMKIHHDKNIRQKNLEEGDLALWYPGK